MLSRPGARAGVSLPAPAGPGLLAFSLALEVYAKKMARSRDTGARMDALLQGAQWAELGTNGADRIDAMPAEKTEAAV